MCLICFLRNNDQYLLRHSAIMRTDRFEHSLGIYKNEFIDGFISNKEKICDDHSMYESNKYIMNAVKEIQVKDIKSFFDKIKTIYIKWINTEVFESIEELEKLIEDFKLDQFSEKLQHNLLFRGRFSNTFVSHWDMFHIPFNRRFLIKNQRYSLVGQPILYFATSPYGAYKELGKYEELKISRFKIKDENSFKVFQNINKFENYISNKTGAYENKQIDGYNIIESDNLDSIMDSEELNDKEYVKSMFFLMILSSCCSFSRKKDTEDKEFAEEYVLPQILTIVLKRKKYEGIKYISTKMYNDGDSKNLDGKIIDMLYSNYCVFTNYKLNNSDEKAYVYDKELYHKFDISNVISYDSTIDSELFNIEKVKILIKEIDEIKSENGYNKDIAYILSDNIDIIERYLELPKNKDDKIVKIINNMHILFIRDILLEVKSKGRNYYEKDI